MALCIMGFMDFRKFNKGGYLTNLIIIRLEGPPICGSTTRGILGAGLHMQVGTCVRLYSR